MLGKECIDSPIAHPFDISLLGKKLEHDVIDTRCMCPCNEDNVMGYSTLPDYASCLSEAAWDEENGHLMASRANIIDTHQIKTLQAHYGFDKLELFFAQQARNFRA